VYPHPSPYRLKDRLITVIQHEWNGWSYWDRREAIDALRRHPGDITPSQDRRLRDVYRYGGSIHRFHQILRERPHQPGPLPSPGPRPSPEYLKQHMINRVQDPRHTPYWTYEDRQYAVDALYWDHGGLATETHRQLFQLLQRGGTVDQFVDLLYRLEGYPGL
jgi:hypothetical protein